MSTSVIPSTFFLTVLMVIGLFFFIRASVKPRIEIVKLTSEQSEESLLSQLRQYFDQRAYRVVAVNAAENQVTFEGVVRPSWFLAILLTLLAAIGMLCFALVLSYSLPDGSNFWLGLLLLSPLAGVFYWRGAGRSEQVFLKVEPSPQAAVQTMITVKGHRDELAELQRVLGLKERDEG
ncbi:cofactor assembly of complex C subunit B [Phormidesmis priestleyi]